MFNAQKSMNNDRKFLIIKPKVIIFFSLSKAAIRYSSKG